MGSVIGWRTGTFSSNQQILKSSYVQEKFGRKFNTFVLQTHGGFDSLIYKKTISKRKGPKRVAKYFSQKALIGLTGLHKGHISIRIGYFETKTLRAPVLSCESRCSFDALCGEWESIPKYYFINIAHSIVSRVSKGKQERGMITKYVLSFILLLLMEFLKYLGLFSVEIMTSHNYSLYLW